MSLSLGYVWVFSELGKFPSGKDPHGIDLLLSHTSSHEQHVSNIQIIDGWIKQSPVLTGQIAIMLNNRKVMWNIFYDNAFRFQTRRRVSPILLIPFGTIYFRAPSCTSLPNIWGVPSNHLVLFSLQWGKKYWDGVSECAWHRVKPSCASSRPHSYSLL